MTSISQGKAQLSVCDSKPDLIRERLVPALTQLYELLEEYAPSWYTQEDHEIAQAALDAVKQRCERPISSARRGHDITANTNGRRNRKRALKSLVT